MKHRMSGDFALLRDNYLFRRLFYAGMVSSFGDWLNSIAVLVLVLDLTGSSAAVGMTLALRVLPYLIMGPIGGVWSDRFRRTRLMIGSDFARALIALGFLLVSETSDVWLVYLLTTLLVVFSALFVPARSAYVSSIVQKNSLGSANALLAGSTGLVMILGMGAGGFITAFFGVTAAFVFNSASFLISAWLLRVGAKEEQFGFIAGGKPSFWLELRQGIQAVAGNRTVSLLFLLEIGWSIGGGAMNVLLSIISHDVYQLGSIGIGISYASLGAGTVLGSILAAQFFKDNINQMRIAAGICFVLDALFHILFANSGSVLVGVLALLGAGAAGSIGSSAIATLLGASIDNRVQGRVFSLFNTIGSTLLAFSMAVVGLLIPVYGTRLIGIAGGGLILCSACAYLILLFKAQQTERAERDRYAA